MNKGSMSIELVGKFILVLIIIAVVGSLIFMFTKSFLGSTENEVSGVGKTCDEMAISLGGQAELVAPGQCDTSKENIFLAKNTLDQADSGNVCCIDTDKDPQDSNTMTCSQAIAYAKTINPSYTYSSGNANSEDECTSLKKSGSYSRSLFVDGIENCCILERKTQ